MLKSSFCEYCNVIPLNEELTEYSITNEDEETSAVTEVITGTEGAVQSSSVYVILFSCMSVKVTSNS